MAVADALSEFRQDPGRQWEGKRQGGTQHGSETPGRCAKNPFLTLGYVLLLVTLVVALDSGLALIAIDRLTQSEYSTVTDAPFRF